MNLRGSIKVLCDWRLEIKKEVASDVARKVSRGQKILDYVDNIKRFLFCSKSNGYT
jgi:hypothetical protein